MDNRKLVELEDKVYAAFEKKHPKSKEIFIRAQKTAPGGVSGAGGGMRPYPIYHTHGQGCKLWDVDGNEIYDGASGSGVNMLGHNIPEINEALVEAMKDGLHGVNHERVIECNELICECIPCAESVRYRNTGTEVCAAAAMMARAYTGKNKIIKFYGAYHGVDPQFLVGWQSRNKEVVSAGCPKEMLVNTMVLMPEVDEVRKALDEDNDIAGVMTDCIMGVGGILPLGPQKLKALRDLCTERGVVLMFDEVLTGWRMALGGAQEYYGVNPDIAVFAKANGGGEKFGCIVGKDEVMQVLNPPPSKTGTIFGGGAKAVFQSGTMNNATLGVAGAMAFMKIMKQKKEQGEYDKLNKRMDRYAAGIEKAFRDHRIGCYVHNAGSYYKLHITGKLDDPDPDYDALCKLDQRLRYLFTVAMMNEDVVLCMPGSGSSFINMAFTDEDIDEVLRRFNTCLDRYNWTEVYES